MVKGFRLSRGQTLSKMVDDSKLSLHQVISSPG